MSILNDADLGPSLSLVNGEKATFSTNNTEHLGIPPLDTSNSEAEINVSGTTLSPPILPSPSPMHGSLVTSDVLPCYNQSIALQSDISHPTGQNVKDLFLENEDSSAKFEMEDERNFLPVTIDTTPQKSALTPPIWSTPVTPDSHYHTTTSYPALPVQANADLSTILHNAHEALGYSMEDNRMANIYEKYFSLNMNVSLTEFTPPISSTVPFSLVQEVEVPPTPEELIFKYPAPWALPVQTYQYMGVVGDHSNENEGIEIVNENIKYPYNNVTMANNQVSNVASLSENDDIEIIYDSNISKPCRSESQTSHLKKFIENDKYGQKKNPCQIATTPTPPPNQPSSMTKFRVTGYAPRPRLFAVTSKSCGFSPTAILPDVTSQDDGNVKVTLEDKDVWKEYVDQKKCVVAALEGRFMSPMIKFKITGLQPDIYYRVSLQLEPVDGVSLKFDENVREWIGDPKRKYEVASKTEPVWSHRMKGSALMNEWGWSRLRLFYESKVKNAYERQEATKRYVGLNMCVEFRYKYLPVLTIFKEEKKSDSQQIFCSSFPECQFIIVNRHMKFH